MDKCNLHTILRLPTGIFYAAGVKTNVLFFERGTSETGNTKKVWFYDMRSNTHSFGKRTPFTRVAFDGFVHAYTGGIHIDDVFNTYDGNVNNEQRAIIQDSRWSCFTRKEIENKNDILDLGLIQEKDYSIENQDNNPIELAKSALKEIEEIQTELLELIALLDG